MKFPCATLFFLTFSCSAFSQTPLEIPLYGDQPIPNSKPAENLEKTEINEWGVSFTTETSEPTLRIFLPETPNGSAVVICPGGAYIGTAGSHEGDEVAMALSGFGIAAFVLKYRLPDDRYCLDKSLAPLQDAQQAMRLVRNRAAEWKISPEKIGIMGFSAGGHLAAATATHFDFRADASSKDFTSTRPDFVALIYPVISFSDSLTHIFSRQRLLGEHPSEEQIRFFSNELQVTAQSPPAFLIHMQDDDAVPVENAIAYYQACLRNKVKAEMHLYPEGGHGFGLYSEDAYFQSFVFWLETLND